MERVINIDLIDFLTNTQDSIYIYIYIYIHTQRFCKTQMVDSVDDIVILWLVDRRNSRTVDSILLHESNLALRHPAPRCAV